MPKFKEILANWKSTIIVGIAILILGLILRISNLDSIPIFADEAIYVRWAQVMKAESTLRFLPLSDGKQPLFMWSVIPFLKLFSDPLIAGRMVSLVTGMGTLCGVFTASYLLFSSKKTGLLASLIYAVSPFSVFFDRMALVDSMLSMFAVWTFVGAVLIAKLKRLDIAMLTGFSLGGALLTKSPGIFFAVLTPTTLLLTKWFRSIRKNLFELTKLVFLWFTTVVIGYGMYNIQRLGPNFHLLSQRNLDYVYPLSHIFQNPLDPFVPFFDRALEYYWIMGPGVLFLFLLYGIYKGFKKFKKELLLLVIWILVPLLIVTEFSKTMTARYILFTTPFVFILASASFLEERKKLGKILNIILVLFLGTSFYLDFLIIKNPQKAILPRSERSGYLEEWTSGVGIKEIAAIIRNQYEASPDEKIVVGTEGYFGTLPDGLQIYLNDLPQITVIGVGVDLTEVPESLKESKAAGNKTYLVINNSRLHLKGGDPNLHGLDVISFFEKAERPPWSEEYRLYGAREKIFLFELTSVVTFER